MGAQTATVAAATTMDKPHTVATSAQVQVPDVQLPASFAAEFKRQFEGQQDGLNWMKDSATFEQKAKEVLDATCPTEVLQQLAKFTTDPAGPSALLLTGLPTEDDLPPTQGDPPIAKASQLTEALLFAFGALWGHAFGYEGMQDRGCVRDLIASNSNMYSSTTELLMHRDFGIAPEHYVPHLRLIYCMRPDKARQVKTLVCDNRALLKQLPEKDVQLLRNVPVKFYGPNNTSVGGGKPTITGPNDDPCVNLFDFGVFGDGAGVTAEDPEAVEAYHRAAKLAWDLSAGVQLNEGQMLVINNNRATHARTKSPIEPDGYGRWLKVTHVRSDIDPTNRYIPMN
jgi:hypothetical protein